MQTTKTIYFVGYLKSPFIKQNASLLKETYNLITFDLSQHATSFQQVQQYIISAFREWRGVRDSDAVYIWFADYPAIPFIIMAKLFGKPMVVHIGGWEVYAAPDINYGNQLSTVRGAATRWILRQADRIIVQSESYKYIVSDLLPAVTTRIIKIPPMINTKLCTDMLPQKTHRVVTAICGNKHKMLKGIPTFYDAVVELNYDSQIYNSVSHDYLINELKRSKVYCQLSYTEHCNNTVIEAMACGCVPVVSDRDGLPEEIGDVGITVPQGDAKATRDAITKAMQMDNQRPRERAMLFSKARAKGLFCAVFDGVMK